VTVEKLLIVEGVLFMIGPPAIVRVDSISTHDVPPRPFVKRTWLVDKKSPVFESRAYTFLRTMVSDILICLYKNIQELYPGQSDDTRRRSPTACGHGKTRCFSHR
jgi:hypothetical protein